MNSGDINQDVYLRLDCFIDTAMKNNKKIAFITSGGCNVRLEKNTVRKISNFSTGTRGSLSAEYFLKNGYSVIFLHHEESKLPFYHRLQFGKIFDKEYILSDEYIQIQKEFQTYKDNIFMLSYNIIEDYIKLLYSIVGKLDGFGNKALIYLSAAVSDFYIPEEKLSEHKIQSKNSQGISSETMELTLYPVAKEINLIKEKLCPKAFLITFKLETDDNMLNKKANDALKVCKSDIVVGNILNKRYDEVTLFIKDRDLLKILKDNKLIEEDLIKVIVQQHNEFIDK